MDIIITGSVKKTAASMKLYNAKVSVMSELIKSTAIPKKLLWIDLEAGGFDETKQPIFEIAMIVTEFCFKEVETFHRVITHPQTVMKNMEEGARKLLDKNGLLAQMKDGVPMSQAEQEACVFVKKHFKKELARVAGNSVHRDLDYLKIWMPDLTQFLSHRIVDVTSFKTYFQMSFGMEFKKEAPHLALEDIRLSIEELKAYSKYIQKD